MSLHVIGVDGGGTKTNGVLMRDDGAVLAEARFPGSNPHASSREQVREVLGGLLQELCRMAAMPLGEVNSICLAMAGVDRPRDRELIEGFVRPLLNPTQQLLVVNDAVAGIMSALDKPHGLMLISGTGSVCFGFREDGLTSRCGGWGQLLGDEGSGYWIALEALKAVIRNFDGREGPTSLTDAILGRLALDQPTDILGWLQRIENSKPEIATLAVLVHEADARGDAVASRILDEAAHQLDVITAPAYRVLFGNDSAEVPIVFGGSNLLKGERFQARVRERMVASWMNLAPVLPRYEAVVGAGRFALLEARRQAAHPVHRHYT